jgi:ankyrin repeat protein
MWNFLESLLEANSGMINYIDDDGDNILHWLCSWLRGELGVALLLLLSAKYSDRFGTCLRSSNENGELPIHIAAQSSTLDVVELLLKEYPESAYKNDNDDNNLLHCATTRMSDRTDRATMNDKVKYLCSRHPDFLLMYNGNGCIPLIRHLRFNFIHTDLETLLTMCETENTIITQTCQNRYKDMSRPSFSYWYASIAYTNALSYVHLKYVC